MSKRYATLVGLTLTTDGPKRQDQIDGAQLRATCREARMSGIIERHDVEIDLRDFACGPTSDYSGIRTDFTFELCRKQTLLGSLPLDQWWVRKPGLYGERGNASPNRQAIVDCFWSLCQAEGSALDDRFIQEVYILATLLPHARSNGSRRVFADASLTKNEHEVELNRTAVIEQLELMLQSASEEELDVLSFYRQTGDVLGPPAYEADVQNCHAGFADEILDEACDAFRLGGTEGLQLALDRWADKMKEIGRRSGHAIEKTVLDVLSYECRTAFHQCYSAVWLTLLEKLQGRFSLTDEGVLFHRLWHLDQRMPSNESNDHDFHFFHGHLFGLHPACGDFICTPTGAALVGELVMAPTNVTRHQRFLNGMLIAIHQYALRNDVAKELRNKQPIASDVEALERGQIERRGGRRSLGRRETDAT